MGPFEIASAAVVLLGIAGVAWVLWPALRPGEPPPSDPTQEPDWPDRLERLTEVASGDDDGSPWTDRRPMLSARRVRGELAPCERIPAVVRGGRAAIVPLPGVLFHAPEHDGPTLRGRWQGRAFHAVRLEGDLFLDLIEAARVLPVVGVELAAHGGSLEGLALFDDLHAVRAAAGPAPDAVFVVAPWLADQGGPRVLPEAPGAQRFALALAGGELVVDAWMPEVARGIAQDRLAWAGVATWSRGAERTRDAGATPVELLARLVDDAEALRAESLESWRWSSDALIEIAGLGQHAETEGLALDALLDDAFADRCVPEPVDGHQATIAAAVLNWRAVHLRRAGRTAAAIAALDAALSICASDDDDNRADILYNRGYTRLQSLMSRPPEPTGPGTTWEAAFDAPPPREALAPALEDLRQAAQLHPTDPHAWSQVAMIHQLLGERDRAAEAWLQAATRTADVDTHTQLLANARAMQTAPGGER